MGKKVVLDTNVLIAALGWEGKPRRILRMVLDGTLDLVICDKQIDELHRVMEYKKFGFPDDQKQWFLAMITSIAMVVHPKGNLKLVKEDPIDNIVLESALMSGAVLVTGDAHLLKISDGAVSPSDFLELIGLVENKDFMKLYKKSTEQITRRDFADWL